MARASKNKPLISIIVPIYNSELYLKDCIESIINQTYKKLEIILVNDGSKDNSGSICDDYAKKDDRIKVFHNKNYGVSYTRNFALSKACGEYIGFVDSDDYLDLNMYEILLNNILKTKSEISVCDVTRDKNKLNNGKNDKVIVYSQRDYIKKYFRINSQTCEYYPVNKLYKKSILKNNMFPSMYHEGEDAIAVLKVVLKAKKIVYCQNNLYYYRINQNSATAHFSNTDWELFNVWDDIVNYIKNNNKEYLDYAILNRKRLNFTFLMRMAINIEPKKLRNNKEAKKLVKQLKNDEKYLLNSTIRIDRKILVFLFCRNYYFISSFLYVIKNIINR